MADRHDYRHETSGGMLRMTMTARYRRVTMAELEVLRSEPVMVGALLEGEQRGSDEQLARTLALGPGWHAIHYLLTGCPWGGGGVLSGAVLGGEPLSEEHFGYGPARFLEPDEVAVVATALGQVTAEDLLAGLDPHDLMANEVYPGVWTGSPSEHKMIAEAFESLQVLFAAAAAHRDGMILYLK